MCRKEIKNKIPRILEPLDEKPHLLSLFLRLCSQAGRGQAGLGFGRRRGSRQRSGGCWRYPLRFLVLPKGEQMGRFRGHCKTRKSRRLQEQRKGEALESGDASEAEQRNRHVCQFTMS